MARTPRVTVDFDFVKDINKLVTKKFQKDLGTAIVKKAKQFISRGISPVKGFGRYKGYAIDRGVPGGYPDGVPGKANRPVNLKLSGDMLKALKFKNVENGVTIGFSDNTNAKILDRVEAHNDGTLEGQNVPQRKMIPDNKGEKWNVTITKLVDKEFQKAVDDYIVKTNKK